MKYLTDFDSAKHKVILLSIMCVIRKQLLLFCILLYSACGGVQQEANDKSLEKRKLSDDTVITKHYVETGGLYNREYLLTIRGTGEITFKGNYAFKEPVVQEQWNVSRDNINRLVEAFYDKNFFQFNDEYGEIRIDMAETTVSIKVDGKEKTITRLSDKNAREEEILRELELLINKTTEAESRIRRDCYFPSDYPFESIP